MAKNIKKQSRTNKVLNWLKPTSAAQGAILFIIIFGVIGGGYMVYKAFAASGVIVQFYDKINNGGNAIQISDCNVDKKCSPAWALKNNTGKVNSTFYLPIDNTALGAEFNACFYVRLPENAF